MFSFRGKSAIVLLEQKRVVNIDLKVQYSNLVPYKFISCLFMNEFGEGAYPGLFIVYRGYLYKIFPALLVMISVC